MKQQDLENAVYSLKQLQHFTHNQATEIMDKCNIAPSMCDIYFTRLNKFGCFKMTRNGTKRIYEFVSDTPIENIVSSIIKNKSIAQQVIESKGFKKLSDGSYVPTTPISSPSFEEKTEDYKSFLTNMISNLTTQKEDIDNQIFELSEKANKIKSQLNKIEGLLSLISEI